MEQQRTSAVPTVVCSWCRVVITKGDKRISHGICQKCSDKQHQEFERRKGPRRPRRH